MSLPSVLPVTLPVTDGGRFPVRRVFCVGRNYAEHAREMGHDSREPPFFFGKHAEALWTAAEVPYPPRTTDLQHEVELVVVLGRDLDPADPRAAIFGYAVGVDLTRRDLQAAAKRQARPWHLAKSWVGAAPIGVLGPAAQLGHPRSGAITLEVGGECRQRGDLAEMIWNVEELLAELRSYDRLLAGDVVFTGTPAGVGPLLPGDQVRAAIAGVGELRFAITG